MPPDVCQNSCLHQLPWPVFCLRGVDRATQRHENHKVYDLKTRNSQCRCVGTIASTRLLVLKELALFMLGGACESCAQKWSVGSTLGIIFTHAVQLNIYSWPSFSIQRRLEVGHHDESLDVNEPKSNTWQPPQPTIPEPSQTERYVVTTNDDIDTVDK